MIVVGFKVFTSCDTEHLQFLCVIFLHFSGTALTLQLFPSSITEAWAEGHQKKPDLHFTSPSWATRKTSYSEMVNLWHCFSLNFRYSSFSYVRWFCGFFEAYSLIWNSRSPARLLAH